MSSGDGGPPPRRVPAAILRTRGKPISTAGRLPREDREMRSRLVLKEVVSVVLAIVFVLLLSIPLGPLPPLGGLLNPNGGVWTVAGDANRPAVQELRLPGLDGDVTVLRDTWGVPHIFATTDHDLFFALGFVHAHDRMWQMDG